MRTLNYLLCQFLSQAFYADLRTKQQLGYRVHAGADFVNGMTGIVFKVQSANTRSPEIENRIRAFFDAFRDEVLVAKENEFSEFIEGAVAKLTDKPERLSSEVSARWTQLSLRNYRFDWEKTAIEILRNLTWEEFLQYWDTMVLAAPKLWIHIVGPQPTGSKEEAAKDGSSEHGSSEEGSIEEVSEELRSVKTPGEFQESGKISGLTDSELESLGQTEVHKSAHFEQFLNNRMMHKTGTKKVNAVQDKEQETGTEI